MADYKICERSFFSLPGVIGNTVTLFRNTFLYYCISNKKRLGLLLLLGVVVMNEAVQHQAYPQSV